MIRSLNTNMLQKRNKTYLMWQSQGSTAVAEMDAIYSCVKRKDKRHGPTADRHKKDLSQKSQ
jgi:hypothetical protein